VIHEATRHFVRENSGTPERSSPPFPVGRDGSTSAGLLPRHAAGLGDSGDVQLLALASELEAAARPYLAYDRDAEVTNADPDYEEARETAHRLYLNVRAVALRIFAHQPESLVGLLVQAHAATLVAEASWQDTSSFVGQDGRLLRIVANGLFRLAGVDWRGRPLAEAPQPQGEQVVPVADEAAVHATLRAHHDAELAYNEAAKAADRIVVARAGGDTSKEGMAPREAALNAAQARCVEA